MARGKKAAPSTSTELVPFDEAWQGKLQKYVDRDAKAVSSTGWAYFSLRSGVLTFNQVEVPTPLDVVILGARYENLYYAEEFDPENPVSPTCFALGEDEANMAPPPEHTKEKGRQAEKCSDCWASAFGTDPKGRRGKACKNVMRLAVIPADDLTPKGVAEQEGARIRIPVTSKKAFGAYVAKIVKGLKRPLFSVVTSIDVEPDPKTQFRVSFMPKSSVPNNPKLLDALLARVDEAETALTETPKAEAEGQPKPAARRGKVRRPVTPQNQPVRQGKPPKRGGKSKF